MDAAHLKKLIETHWVNPDDGMATHILHACASTGLPLSYGLALVEKETGGRNVFGHDPTSSIPNGWKGGHVTRMRYRWYKLRRRQGRGMQGVGPTQLTWFAYQDAADRIGGCRRPYPSMCVGFSLLKSKINQLGKEKGAAAFNGTGPAAEHYGRDFVLVQEKWHARVT